jgi:Leucine-rich repeat (LRR) protein
MNKLKNLKNVYINSNLLFEIPYELCDIKLLDHVDLFHNQIQSITDKIAHIDCIELNLNDNRINYISTEIAKCPRLKVLRLENNILELNKIPRTLLVDSKVALLTLDGNLFTQKQLQNYDGYDAYMERYTATKRKFD